MKAPNVILANLALHRAQFWTNVRATIYEVVGWLVLFLVDWRIAVGLALIAISLRTFAKAAQMGQAEVTG